MSESWVSQIRKGLVELCVLAVLRRGESYGYGIVRELQEVEALAFNEGTVYPALTRLSREGLLAVRNAPSPLGPPRRYYRLTARGRERLGEMRAYWGRFSSDVAGLLDRAKGAEG